MNLRALRSRAPEHPALGRCAEIARIVVHEGEPSPERAVAELGMVRKRLGVRPLSAFGVSAADLPAIIAGSRAGSMRSNPIELTDEELSEILTSALVESA